MSNVIPIVSSSPPPFEDDAHSFEEDHGEEDDFGGFASAPSAGPEPAGFKPIPADSFAAFPGSEPLRSEPLGNGAADPPQNGGTDWAADFTDFSSGPPPISAVTNGDQDDDFGDFRDSNTTFQDVGTSKLSHTTDASVKDTGVPDKVTGAASVTSPDLPNGTDAPDETREGDLDVLQNAVSSDASPDGAAPCRSGQAVRSSADSQDTTSQGSVTDSGLSSDISPGPKHEDFAEFASAVPACTAPDTPPENQSPEAPDTHAGPEVTHSGPEVTHTGQEVTPEDEVGELELPPLSSFPGEDSDTFQDDDSGTFGQFSDFAKPPAIDPDSESDTKLSDQFPGDSDSQREDSEFEEFKKSAGDSGSATPSDCDRARDVDDDVCLTSDLNVPSTAAEVTEAEDDFCDFQESLDAQTEASKPADSSDPGLTGNDITLTDDGKDSIGGSSSDSTKDITSGNLSNLDAGFSKFEPPPMPEDDDDDDDFADFADFKSSGPSDPPPPPADDGGDEFAAFQDSSTPAAVDGGWAAFGSSQVVVPEEDDDDWAAFGDAKEPEMTSKPSASSLERFADAEGVAEDDDDDFGDFGDHTSTISAPSAPITKSKPVTAEGVTSAVTSCFPEQPLQDDEFSIAATLLRETLDLQTLRSQEPEPQARLPANMQHKHRSVQIDLNVWNNLKDLEQTAALKYTWGTSSHYQRQLRAIGIDKRNILMGHKKASMPIFAASLGLLEPTRGSEKTSPVMSPPLEPELVTSSTKPATSSSSSNTGTPQQDIPPAEFDWSSAGLTNPLDASSSLQLDLDFFIKQDSSNRHRRSRSEALEKEQEILSALEPTRAEPPKVLQPLDAILGTLGYQSTQPEPQRKPDMDCLTPEASKLLSKLPDLSFMKARMLMFPLRGATD